MPIMRAMHRYGQCYMHTIHGNDTHVEFLDSSSFALVMDSGGGE